MRFDVAVDQYLTDMRSQGRLSSARSALSYRGTLEKHGEDVGNRDPANVSRDDVKRTLRRWSHPNTQRTNRSVLISFYTWCEEEGIRRDNPARQTPRPRRRPVEHVNLTRGEAWRILQAARTTREKRAVYLLLCAGLRNGELRGMRGGHFGREGYVWVTPDIGKGGRAREIPVSRDLRPVVAEIRSNVAVDEFVLPAQRFRNPPANTERMDLRFVPSSSQALIRMVEQLASRAGVSQHVTPHDLRHAYANHIARGADTRIAQYALGHAYLATTDIYMRTPLLDEVTAALVDLTYEPERTFPSTQRTPDTAREATTGIEPV